MTEQEARQRLQQCLLDLLPANGSMVGNGILLAQWTRAAQAAGLTVSAEDFSSLREDLMARGLVVKGTLFDASDKVNAYAKNDHLGFQIYHLRGGSRKRFIPDFIVGLANGRNLMLELKGEDSPMNSAKRDALVLWVKAVNAKGGFGSWCWDVAFKPAEIQDILSRHDVAIDDADRKLTLTVAAEASPKD